MKNNFNEKEFRENVESIVDVFEALLNPEKLGKIFANLEVKTQEMKDAFEKDAEFVKEFNERKGKEFKEEYKKHQEKMNRERYSRSEDSCNCGCGTSHSYGTSKDVSNSIKKETTETPVKDVNYYKNLARNYAKKHDSAVVKAELKARMEKIRKDVLDKLEDNINRGKFYVDYPIENVRDRKSGENKLLVQKVMSQLKKEGFRVKEKDFSSTHPYYRVELFLSFGKD